MTLAMFLHTRNPFDARPPGNPDTAGFLAALGDSEAAAAYRKAMGEEEGSTTTNTLSPEPTPEELARLQAITDRERGREPVELRKREYLEWAEEFNLGDDPETWIADTFKFNPDGTVEVDGNLDLANKSLTRFPPALTRVNGNLTLWDNQLTSLEGLPKVIHGNLYLPSNQLISLTGLTQKIHGDLVLSYNDRLTSLNELQGKRIYGDLYLLDINARSIPDGLELWGAVFMNDYQTVLKQDAISNGYTVREG